jgi:hypothetical protein
LRHDVERDFNSRLQNDMQCSGWVSGCRSPVSIRLETGKVTAVWPGFTFSFRKRTQRVRPRGPVRAVMFT